MSDLLTHKIKVGLLGHDNINIAYLDSGINIVLLKESKVVDISSNSCNSIFVFEDGQLYACFSDSYKNPDKTTEEVGESELITKVKCGLTHTVALNKQGELLTWSNKAIKQKGSETCVCIPKPVKKDLKYISSTTSIKQIACGFEHTIALNHDGTVCTWGSNLEGQLGVEEHDGSFHDEPEIINSLTGLVVSCMAAGASHSFVLTTSGVLLGWGVNEFGQLGVGDKVNRSNPELCILPVGEKIKYVACGDRHSAILSDKGNVYTFGDGRHGQLGYSSNCETKPKKVTLPGTAEVSMVACGSTHTAIYDKLSDTIYVFGCGSNIKAGYEAGSFIPIKGTTLGQGSIVRSLHAGWDQTFVTFSSDDEKYPQRDNRKIIEDQQIDVITSESIMNCTSITDDLDKRIRTIFKSLSCINGSFYNNSERNCSAEDHGVNNDACKKLFELISEHKPLVPKNMLSGLGFVESSLKLLAIESLRVFVILPFMPMVHAKKFLRNILELDDNHWKVLENWWQISGKDYLLRLVKLLKNMLPKIIEEKYEKLGFPSQRKTFAPLNVMKKIRDSSVISGLSDEVWYLEHIENLCNLGFEYYCWRFLENYEGVRLCDYSFIFDEKAKSILLEMHAAMEMRMALDDELANNHDALYTSLEMPLDYIADEKFHLKISRSNLFADAMNILQEASEAEYKKPLKVEFLGEAGVDNGGLGREFIRLFMEELLKKNLFKENKISSLFWFCDDADLHLIRLVGVAFGLALYNGYNIFDVFPLLLYKVLLERSPSSEDFEETWPDKLASFQRLLDYEGDVEEDLCYDFRYLVPDGENIMVNKANRSKYVKMLKEHILNNHAKDKRESFRNGFITVWGGSILQLIEPEELRKVFTGNEIDWNELKETAEYIDYTVDHPTIALFWEVIEEMSEMEKNKFLVFISGCERMPLSGLKITIELSQMSEDYLPFARVCFNLLQLYPYNNKDTLRERLLQSMEERQYLLA